MSCGQATAIPLDVAGWRGDFHDRTEAPLNDPFLWLLTIPGAIVFIAIGVVIRRTLPGR